MIRIAAMGVCAAMLCAASAWGVPDADVIQTEQTLHELTAEQEETVEVRSEAANELDRLQAEQMSLRQSIEERQKQVDVMDLKMTALQDERDSAQMEYDDIATDYAMRIRAIEEYGTSVYWEILFKATSLTDLLGRIDYVQELMRANETALSAADTEVKALAAKEAQLEELREARRHEVMLLKDEQNTLEKKLRQQALLLRSLDMQVEEQSKEIERLEEEARRLRLLVADDSSYERLSAETMYRKYVVDPGYASLYPEGAYAVRLALRWLGHAYVWGGESPAEGGFDCSGLVYYVYHTQLGYDMHRVGGPQYYYDGRFIDDSDLRPGDLVYFENTYKPGLSHTGIYISSGLFIHAANESAGIKISSLSSEYFASRYCGAKRILPG